MVYSNWEVHANSIESVQWYSLKRTLMYLNNLTRFIIDTPGKMSEIRCPQLQEAELEGPPADKSNRCSENDLYLCEVYGDWKMNMDLLQLGVCSFLFPERCDREYPFFQTQGEAEVYVIKKINVVAEKARKYRIQQSEFERFFNLSWIHDDKASAEE